MCQKKRKTNLLFTACKFTLKHISVVEVLKNKCGSSRSKSYSNPHPYFSQQFGSFFFKKRNISWTPWWWSLSQGRCRHLRRGSDPEADFLHHDDEEDDHEQREEGTLSPCPRQIHRPCALLSSDPPPGTSSSPDPTTELRRTTMERHCYSLPPHHHHPHHLPCRPRRRTEERELGLKRNI